MQIKVIGDLWMSGHPCRAGWSIYEAIPNDSRPTWAADILNLACSQLPVVPDELNVILAIASDPKRWHEGREAFSAFRNHTSLEERTHAGRVHAAVFRVADYATRVMYNASGQPAPFDPECGYVLVGALRELVDEVGSPQFELQAWNLLASWLPSSRDPLSEIAHA